jgi:hypothetical protein
MNLNDLSRKGLVLGCGRASHRPSKQIRDDTSDYFLLSGCFTTYKGSTYVFHDNTNIVVPRLDLRCERSEEEASNLINEFKEVSSTLPLVSFSDLGYSSDGKSLIILETTYAGNLFHFICDVMGKMAVAAEFVPISKSIFLLYPWQSFHREAFDCAGLSYRVIDYANVYTGDCIIPSLAGRPTFMPRFTVNFLRRLYSHIPAHEHSGILYISRNHSKTRRMTNEDDLLDKLLVLDIPILKVYLEDYSFPEFVNLNKRQSSSFYVEKGKKYFLELCNELLDKKNPVKPHIKF